MSIGVKKGLRKSTLLLLLTYGSEMLAWMGHSGHVDCEDEGVRNMKEFMRELAWACVEME